MWFCHNGLPDNNRAGLSLGMIVDDVEMWRGMTIMIVNET